MKLDIAVREKDNLRAAVRLLKFFIIVIGLAVVYQSYKVGKAIEYQKTILVPFRPGYAAGGIRRRPYRGERGLLRETGDFLKGDLFSRDHPEEL